MNVRMQMHAYRNPVQARWWRQSACGASETSQAVDPQTSTSPHLPSRALELRRPLVHILICQRHRLALLQVFKRRPGGGRVTPPNGGMWPPNAVWLHSRMHQGYQSALHCFL